MKLKVGSDFGRSICEAQVDGCSRGEEAEEGHSVFKPQKLYVTSGLSGKSRV